MRVLTGLAVKGAEVPRPPLRSNPVFNFNGIGLMGELGLAERVLTELRHLVLTKIRGCPPPLQLKTRFFRELAYTPPVEYAPKHWF